MPEIEYAIKVHKPGTATCRCGRQALVKACKFTEHEFPKGVGNKVVRELGGDVQKVKDWLKTLPKKEVWHLTYKCETCGNILTLSSPKMTREEAVAIADPDKFSPPYNQ